MAEEPMTEHDLTLRQRSSLMLTGVTEVLSFDEMCVVMRTPLGILSVQGKDLRLKNVTAEGGNVAVEGTISAFSYEEPKSPGGLARRLFG